MLGFSLVGSLPGLDLVELCAAQFPLSDGLDPCGMSLLPLDQLHLLGLTVLAIPFQLFLLSVPRI